MKLKRKLKRRLTLKQKILNESERLAIKEMGFSKRW